MEIKKKNAGQQVMSSFLGMCPESQTVLNLNMRSFLACLVGNEQYSVGKITQIADILQRQSTEEPYEHRSASSL